jgi:hypothetical protein
MPDDSNVLAGVSIEHLRPAFERAYEAWLDELVTLDEQGRPWADAIADHLFQYLCREVAASPSAG